MDHDPITDADVQRFLEQGAQHVRPTPRPAPPVPGAPAAYDHHERFTGETLSNLT